MRTQHTPGPWTVDHDAVSHNGAHIAFAIGHDGDDYATQCANARLVAAAPDLLAALQEILDAEEGVGETDRPHMIRARAAIAKATGSAQ